MRADPFINLTASIERFDVALRTALWDGEQLATLWMHQRQREHGRLASALRTLLEQRLGTAERVTDTAD